jgi:HemK-related putative methylase
MLEIYTPREDSYFFSDFLKKNLKQKNISFLDMGCGSGILSLTAKDLGIKEITAVDININAVKETKKLNIKTIHSNLFEKIKKEDKFDIICFNAPYLPLDKREPKDSRIATTGGKYGDEISLKFLKQAKKHLNKDGKIYLLISSLTRLNKIQKYNPKIIAQKNIFNEKLIILKIN